MAVDNEYIYIVDNIKVNIYGKYNGVPVNDFLILGINDNRYTDASTNLAIDNDNIYIGANSGKTNKIKIFKKNGKFVKDKIINQKISALAVDNEYIYVAHVDTIFKYTKNDLKFQAKRYIMRNCVYISNISVDDKYVYSLNRKSIMRSNLILSVFDKNSTVTIFEKEKIENSLFCQMDGKIYLCSPTNNSVKIVNIENNKIGKLRINNKELADFNENVKEFAIDNEFIYIVKNKNIQIYAQ